VRDHTKSLVPREAFLPLSIAHPSPRNSQDITQVHPTSRPLSWLPAAFSQPNMLAQFGTQNDAAAFPHAAASGNRLWVAPQSGAGLLFGGYDDDDLGAGQECVLAGAV